MIKVGGRNCPLSFALKTAPIMRKNLKIGGTKMLNFIKGIGVGIVIGFKWEIELIRKESKWYIIPFVLDMIFIPIKLPIVLLACLTKKGRNWLMNTFKEIVEED